MSYFYIHYIAINGQGAMVFGSMILEAKGCFFGKQEVTRAVLKENPQCNEAVVASFQKVTKAEGEFYLNN